MTILNFQETLKKHSKLRNLKRVPPMDFYQKTVKIDKFEKGTPYVFFIKKHSKWTNLKMVPPMLFYRKTRKIDKYEKDTPYTFL